MWVHNYSEPTRERARKAQSALCRRWGLLAAALQRLDELLKPRRGVLHQHAPHVRRTRTDGVRGGGVVDLMRRGALGFASQVTRAPRLSEHLRARHLRGGRHNGLQRLAKIHWGPL